MFPLQDATARRPSSCVVFDAIGGKRADHQRISAARAPERGSRSWCRRRADLSRCCPTTKRSRRSRSRTRDRDRHFGHVRQASHLDLARSTRRPPRQKDQQDSLHATSHALHVNERRHLAGEIVLVFREASWYAACFDFASTSPCAPPRPSFDDVSAGRQRPSPSSTWSGRCPLALRSSIGCSLLWSQRSMPRTRDSPRSCAVTVSRDRPRSPAPSSPPRSRERTWTRYGSPDGRGVVTQRSRSARRRHHARAAGL